VSRALVTGATGQVGSYIVERLITDGWQVRALVRNLDRAQWLNAMGVELIEGEVLNADRFRRAAAGCETIFHAAAVVTATGNWETFRRANVDGTRHAIEAAESSGARLLHVSSVAVYGGAARYRSTPTDETTPLAPLPKHSYYARSKRESEQLVLDAHANGRIWACAVRPNVIYGRRDRQFVPRVARIMTEGFFPLIAGGHTTLAIVHAASVADGAVRAVHSAEAGGRAYNLANDFDVTVSMFIHLAAEGLGRRVRPVPVSLPLARVGFRFLQWGMLLAQGKGMASQSSSTLDFLTRNNPFSSERARRELGWIPPLAPEISIPEAFRWWKLHRQ
jgi:dihydroflavonol-4-reductase